MKPLIAMLSVALLATPAIAHEDGVYESLGHIPVGRIFLSPEERARLDKVRGKSPVQSKETRPAGSSGNRVNDKDAAGFIVSDSGTTRVWKNGDFVETASVSNVRFPGQVRVASKSVPRDTDDNVESDDSVDSTVEAGDEQE